MIIDKEAMNNKIHNWKTLEILAKCHKIKSIASITLAEAVEKFATDMHRKEENLKKEMTPTEYKRLTAATFWLLRYWTAFIMKVSICLFITIFSILFPITLRESTPTKWTRTKIQTFFSRESFTEMEEGYDTNAPNSFENFTKILIPLDIFS